MVAYIERLTCPEAGYVRDNASFLQVALLCFYIWSLFAPKRASSTLLALKLKLSIIHSFTGYKNTSMQHIILLEYSIVNIVRCCQFMP